MRRIALAILATASLSAAFVPFASAADMPVKAPPPRATAYNWNGFYIGAGIGARRTSEDRSVAVLQQGPEIGRMGLQSRNSGRPGQDDHARPARD
jgi:opacity protein-like surface antigen